MEVAVVAELEIRAEGEFVGGPEADGDNHQDRQDEEQCQDGNRGVARSQLETEFLAVVGCIGRIRAGTEYCRRDGPGGRRGIRSGRDEFVPLADHVWFSSMTEFQQATLPIRSR